jgi:phosphatidyl-myo-inositol dimannoside synthase
MRLLYVSHSLPPAGDPLANPGGMQRVSAELAEALAAHPEIEYHELVLRATWRATPFLTLPFLVSLLVRLPRLVRREGIDAVLFSSMVTASVAPVVRRFAALAGVQLAAIPIGQDVTLPVLPWQRYLRLVFRSLDVLFPISRATAKACTARGVDEERLTVVPCGIDRRRFSDAPERLDALRRLERWSGGRLRLPRGGFLICTMGRHVERKGFLWFVREVAPLLPAGVRVWMGGDGPLTASIQEEIERRGLRERVVLTGKIPEELLSSLYRAADLFVMPNIPISDDIEGFGVVLLEAGLAGTPIVAADLEGIRDVIRDGVNGVIVPSRDPPAFIRAIDELRREPGRREAIARSAVGYTHEHFSWDRIAERLRSEMAAARHTEGKGAYSGDPAAVSSRPPSPGRAQD